MTMEKCVKKRWEWTYPLMNTAFVNVSRACHDEALKM